MSRPVLSVRELSVMLRGNGGAASVVDGISFSVNAGEVLALVGESGCGKSKTAEALMGLLPGKLATRTAASIALDGAELTGLSEKAMRRVRGREISMVFQEPMTALDPVFTAGQQLSVVYRRHRAMSRAEAKTASRAMLQAVGLADTGRIMNSYPHELSGGMRQRVMLAMALACRPRLLIADEATTALDVTTQAQVLDRMTSLCRENGTALLLITHDLGVVAQYCDRALVMKSGRIVEDAPVQQLFTGPQSSYTEKLLHIARGEHRQ